MYGETYSIFNSKQESPFADKILFRKEDYKANVNDCKSLMWSKKDTKVENSLSITGKLYVMFRYLETLNNANSVFN